MRFFGLVVVLAALLSGCATYDGPMQAAPELLTAKADLEVKKVQNNSQKIEIDIEHLAPPEKIQPGATVFVVWAQPLIPEGAPAQNIGAFVVDNELEADLVAMTPYATFDLFVTAETSRSVVAPSGKRLLWARVD